MAIPVNSGEIYTDVSSLRSLKRDAATGSQEALQKTAEQFEALFLQMMLKTMRQASPSDGPFDSDQTRFYQEMFDQQIAIDMAKRRQVGIADMLVKQLGKGDIPATENTAPLRLDLDRLRLAGGVGAAAPQPGPMPVTAPSPVVAAPAALPAALPVAIPDVLVGEESSAAEEESRTTPSVLPPPPPLPAPPVVAGGVAAFDSPADFVERIYPLAKKYGEELGIDPKALLAQAALETGWGRKVVRDASGKSSYNLFNIKADQRWSGPRAVVSTLEYENGKAVRQQAAFRAYSGFEASFRDYADFLRSSPRYQQALAQGDDGRAFARELSEAGYATDPKYAHKIGAILAKFES